MSHKEYATSELHNLNIKVKMYRTFSIFLSISLMVIFLCAASSKENAKKIVDTERLILRDRDGKIRAEMGTTPENAMVIALINPAGKSSIGISLDADGEGEFSFLDENDKERISLKATPDGQAGLYLYDNKTNSDIRVCIDKDSNFQVVCARNNKTAIGFSSTPTGLNSLNVHDKKGNYLVGLGVKSDGIPGLWFMDENGKDRIKISYTDKGEAGIILIDKDGKKQFDTRIP